MKTRLLFTLFLLLLLSTGVSASPVTYAFSGYYTSFMAEAIPQLSDTNVGDTFTGTFTYDNEAQQFEYDDFFYYQSDASALRVNFNDNYSVENEGPPIVVFDDIIDVNAGESGGIGTALGEDNQDIWGEFILSLYGYESDDSSLPETLELSQFDSVTIYAELFSLEMKSAIIYGNVTELKPIPVPPALLLMATGLLGLRFVNRKK
jgi:hypothetical protein